jgi:hypothetical protein
MRYTDDTTYDDRFSYIIDNEKYIFKATLFNPDGDLLTLTKSVVLELNIFDNIFEPWLKGTIILDNTEDALERFVAPPNESEFNSNAQSIKGYTVRGDGRDILKIEILPIDGSRSDYNTGNDKYNKIFAFKYVFCLEDEESMDYDGKSAKKYAIMDYDLEILKERKVFFTSSDVLDKNSSDVTQLSNKDREVPTGECMKYILQKALNDKLAIYSQTNIDNGNEITPFFESGISKIFYSSPAENNTFDDLSYILNRHVSSGTKNDFSFLKKENYTGEYTLKGAFDIFKNAYDPNTGRTGPRFLENFTITGSSHESASIIEKEQKKPDNALEFGEKSEVLDYKFFNTSPRIRRDKIKSHITHSYDFNKKEFNIDMIDGNIENVRDVFANNYVAVMKGKDRSPYPNFIINGMQRDNLTYENKFSEYGDNPTIRKATGINKLLKNALVTNMGVELTVKGQLQRKSGRFFSIDRAGDYIDNSYDNKLLGIYFILDVQHLFVNDNQYLNKLIAVKTYHFDNPKYKEISI